VMDQSSFQEHQYHGAEVLPIEPRIAQTLALNCQRMFI
jgi:hypothetical protein